MLVEDRKRKEDLLQYEADPDDIEWRDDPFANAGAAEKSADELVDLIQLGGTPDLNSKLRALCLEFGDVFAETVRPEPASVPPMDINVDWKKWQTPKNRGPPRVHSREKQEEIKKQVAMLQQLKVIVPSKASEYSHVHLIPKPTPNTWRFCLDFVRLNDVCGAVEGWPIPNIAQMIIRIGHQKPKLFGKIDLTSGYHQAPLSAAAQLATAFICFMGVFQWLRVPMGLKGAPAYFQRVMATVVLVGLIYTTCELYLDDIFLYADTEQAFLARIRQVFERFRKHRITANPKNAYSDRVR
jgi:hypothetical protein